MIRVTLLPTLAALDFVYDARDFLIDLLKEQTILLFQLQPTGGVVLIFILLEFLDLLRGEVLVIELQLIEFIHRCSRRCADCPPYFDIKHYFYIQYHLSQDIHLSVDLYF